MRAVQLAEAMKGMSHKPRQKPAIDSFRAEQIATAGLDATRGALMGVTTDVLGYPVDLAASALRPFGYNVEQPVGGSDWLANNLTSPTGSKAEWAGRIATGMITPGPEELLRMGGMLPRKAPVNELITYHGSPHRINNVTPDAPYGKFDLSKVGTGEGAQAYGHGIYLAETPGVARSYQTAGVDKFNLANDVKKTAQAFYEALDPLSDGNVLHKGRMYSKDQFFADFTGGKISPHDFGPSIRTAVEKKLMPEGHFYTVDLPDEHIAKMLDWDAPLSEQPEILASLRRSGYAVADDPSITGGELYRKLTQEMGAQPDEISAALLADGIPGIRYLDGNSRVASFGAQDKGTRNFVIFDPDTAKILKRE